MKKLSCLCILSSLIVLFGSCGNKSQSVPFDNGDSVYYAQADPTLFGVCGVETTMNTLQLITDTGDTLMLDISDAKDRDMVFGGLQAGDRMAIIPSYTRDIAKMVINQTALLGNWVMPNPIDGSDEVGISIKEGGVTESIEQGSIIYRTWRLVKGHLEITLVRDGANDVEELNIYDITKLTADSLVYRDAEEVFEYSRQKPKETYGDDVKLEDVDYDDFKM